MHVPISITSFQRPFYLKKMVASLIEKSNPEDVTDIAIYDDCSDAVKTLELLKQYEKTFKVHIQEKNRGTLINTKLAIQDAFDRNPESEYMFLFQNDIEFSVGWREKTLETLELIEQEQGRYGIVSLIHFRPGHSTTEEIDRAKKQVKPYYYIDVGHCGGCAWLVNRRYWNYYRESPKNAIYHCPNRNSPHLCDYRITAWGYPEWVTCYLGDSVVNHFGVESSVKTGKDMKGWVGLGFPEE